MSEFGKRVEVESLLDDEETNLDRWREFLYDALIDTRPVEKYAQSLRNFPFSEKKKLSLDKLIKFGIVKPSDQFNILAKR